MGKWLDGWLLVTYTYIHHTHTTSHMPWLIFTHLHDLDAHDASTSGGSCCLFWLYIGVYIGYIYQCIMYLSYMLYYHHILCVISVIFTPFRSHFHHYCIILSVFFVSSDVYMLSYLCVIKHIYLVAFTYIIIIPPLYLIFIVPCSLKHLCHCISVSMCLFCVIVCIVCVNTWIYLVAFTYTIIIPPIICYFIPPCSFNHLCHCICMAYHVNTWVYHVVCTSIIIISPIYTNFTPPYSFNHLYCCIVMTCWMWESDMGVDMIWQRYHIIHHSIIWMTIYHTVVCICHPFFCRQ